MWQILSRCNTAYTPACLSLHAAALHEVVIIQGIIELVVIEPGRSATPPHIQCLLLAGSCSKDPSTSVIPLSPTCSDQQTGTNITTKDIHIMLRLH